MYSAATIKCITVDKISIVKAAMYAEMEMCSELADRDTRIKHYCYQSEGHRIACRQADCGTERERPRGFCIRVVWVGQFS